MGGLKSAFKSVKRFVKKNTRDIATVIGFALGGPMGAAIGQGVGSLGEGRDLGDSVKSSLKVYAGASMAQGAGIQGNQGIGSLNPMGENFMFAPGNIGPGMTADQTSGVGGYFEDLGASTRNLFTGEGTLGERASAGFGKDGRMGQSFQSMGKLGQAATVGMGLNAVGAFDGMGQDEPATMPGPIDQSGYLQRGLTPATLSDVYGTGTGITGSMPSLAQSYDYDPINSSIAELLKQQDEYELEFPEFARVGMRDGGSSETTKVARLADGGIIPDLDLRDTGGDIVDEEGSGDEDTVPAILADGEFVMTKQAVAGMGNGDHDKGIAQLYAMMDMNENKAQQMGIGRA